jgi:uncharacterized cofD-like protein
MEGSLRKKIVTLGGGTGNFVLLTGLKKYNLDLSAIVSMADDGGSTGILRDELGVLPPGDVRQCLVALAESSQLLRNLMEYRFENGSLGGHSFGNLLLSALQKTTGSFESAIEEVGKILSIRGKVIPVTTHPVRLKMILNDGTLLDGEGKIYTSSKIDQGYKKIYLEPSPEADKHALQAIKEADYIIIGPGGLYSSLISNLLVPGISNALKLSKAKKIFVSNLMNRRGQTTGFTLSRHIKSLEGFIDKNIFDHIIINDGEPPQHLVEAYREEGELVKNDLMDDPRIITAPLLAGALKEKQGGDKLRRNLIRHDSAKLAEVIMKIVGS